MNLGPKDELLPVKRDTLESLLVSLGSGLPPDALRRRRGREAERIRRLLRDGGER